MELENYILQIKIHLVNTHAELLQWFDQNENLKSYKPKLDAWSVSEVLEHVLLTSHFLLILIDKGAAKALRNAENKSLDDLLAEFDFDLEKMDEIGTHNSFEWFRPDHMVPKGEKTENEIKSQLISQLNRCLNHLVNLKNGEGLLHKTRMSVNNSGKINVYEYIYFLSKHAERHIQQMKKIKNHGRFYSPKQPKYCF